MINYSCAHCTIPMHWKHGTIIAIPKPNKPPTTPTSYRPITLLCTTYKVMERIILTIINPHILLSKTQHIFYAYHFTTTWLANLSQQILYGFKHNPPHHTVLVTVNFSKVSDSISCPLPTDKIYSITFHNNTKDGSQITSLEAMYVYNTTPSP